MGLDALPRWLEAAGVPTEIVVVGDPPGPVDAVWRIRAVGDGEPGWEVFWCDAGRRSAWVRFDDEPTACFALLGRLVWTRLARGLPAGPAGR